MNVLAGASVYRDLASEDSVAALVGTSGLLSFEIPVAWAHLAIVVTMMALIALALRLAFASIVSRAMTPVVSGARDLAKVLRQPHRAAALFGASMGVTASYGLVLMVSVLALGGDVSMSRVFAVYLGAAAVGSASSTPGNLGAVEVALSAGLTAVGVASGPAVGAVLIYRLLTFWLPILPGFLAFQYLQRKRHI